MFSAGLFLLFLVAAPNPALCSLVAVPLVKDEGIRGDVLFHRYYFKEANQFPQEFVPELMEYSEDLRKLLDTYLRDQTEEFAEHHARLDVCYRHLLEQPWYPVIKPSLMQHLADVLSTLIEKDAKLSADCGNHENSCPAPVARAAELEIRTFKLKELAEVKRLNEGYLRSVKHLMDHCMYQENKRL